MKKRIASLLTVVLILGSTACSSPSASAVDQPIQSASEKDSTTKADTVPANSPAAPSATSAAQTESPVEEPAKTEDASIEETLLVDEKDIRITVTGLEYDGWMGPAVKVLIENGSDKDLTVQTRASSVNGYMMESMISADVAAGKKANDEISFMSSDLEAAGISGIADIELSFHVFTTDGWDEYLDTEPVIIKTSLADDYEYTFDDAGEVLYDKKDIRIIAKGISNDDSLFGPGLILFIENLGKKSITVQARDVSVNGFMIDHSLSSEVSPQKRSIDAMTFFQSDLEENSIEKITDVELAFHIFETSDWDTIDDTKKYVLEFE